MTEQTQESTSLPVSVVIVDDQAVFRQVAREVIDATAGFEQLGEAAGGEEALALADEVEADLVLIDVRMPGMSGIETARRLSASHPRSRIVLISTDEPGDMPSDAESCGAVALLSKEDFGPPALRRLWALHGPPSPAQSSAHAAHG